MEVGQAYSSLPAAGGTSRVSATSRGKSGTGRGSGCIGQGQRGPRFCHMRFAVWFFEEVVCLKVGFDYFWVPGVSS